MRIEGWSQGLQSGPVLLEDIRIGIIYHKTKKNEEVKRPKNLPHLKKN